MGIIQPRVTARLEMSTVLAWKAQESSLHRVKRKKKRSNNVKWGEIRQLLVGGGSNTLNLQSSSARAVQEVHFLHRQKMWGGNYLFSLIHSGLVTHRKMLHNEGYIFFAVVKILIHYHWKKKINVFGGFSNDTLCSSVYRWLILSCTWISLGFKKLTKNLNKNVINSPGCFVPYTELWNYTETRTFFWCFFQLK